MKIIIAILLVIITFLLFPSGWAILSAYFAGVVAHSSDRDMAGKLSTKQSRSNV